LKTGDPERDRFYNAACIMAVLGARDRAFDYLEKAVQAGYSERRALTRDPDLNSLRQDPRFRKILAMVPEV
jgi:hypothetical protein